MKPVSVNVRIWSSKSISIAGQWGPNFEPNPYSSQNWIVVGRIVPRRFHGVYALLKLDMEFQKMGLENQFLLN